MNSNNLPRIGAHLPIGKGLVHTATEAGRLGVEALQVFLRNPRGMKAREFQTDEVEHFRRVMQELDIFPLVAHIPYICNPAAVREDLYQLAHRVVTEDLIRCDLVGVDYLVLHPGAFTTSSPEKAIARLVGLLNRVLADYSGATMILVETMAGQGSEIGRSFEEMGQILEGVAQSSRIGVCLDTCHLYAAGYDVATPEGLETVVEKIEQTTGLEPIRLIHANDCIHELGSRRDRHASIGEGCLQEQGFSLLCHHAVFRRFPFILETPYASIEKDLNTLKRIRATRSL